MSTIEPTYDDPTVGGEAVARRDLSGVTGLLLFIPALACIIGLNVAAAKGRLFGGE